MDSKYSIVGKIKSSESNSFGPNLKRKFSYGSPNSAPQPKRPNLQNIPKLSMTTPKTNESSTSAKNTVVDIQMQRKLLPVFAVRDQYVNITLFFSNY